MPNPILSHLSTCCTTVLHPSLICYRKKKFRSHLCFLLVLEGPNSLHYFNQSSFELQTMNNPSTNKRVTRQDLKKKSKDDAGDQVRIKKKRTREARALRLHPSCLQSVSKNTPLTSTSGLKSNQTRWNWGYPPCQTPKNRSVKFCWNKIPVK